MFPKRGWHLGLIHSCGNFVDLLLTPCVANVPGYQGTKQRFWDWLGFLEFYDHPFFQSSVADQSTKLRPTRWATITKNYVLWGAPLRACCFQNLLVLVLTQELFTCSLCSSRPKGKSIKNSACVFDVNKKDSIFLSPLFVFVPRGAMTGLIKGIYGLLTCSHDVSHWSNVETLNLKFAMLLLLLLNVNVNVAWGVKIQLFSIFALCLFLLFLLLCIMCVRFMYVSEKI